MYWRLYVSEDRTVCAVRLKNMKQRQSGHAVKGPAYGCSHIILWTQIVDQLCPDGERHGKF